MILRLTEIYDRAIVPALALLPAKMTSPEAVVELLAIGLQESQFEHRRQVIKKKGQLVPLGPAKSFWQGERFGGMTAGTVRHPASRYWMHHVCEARGVKFNATAIWNSIETDDILAAAAARLLLFTDPKRLPSVGDENAAWNLYLRAWRPGAWERGTKQERAELRKKWARNYAIAQKFVSEMS